MECSSKEMDGVEEIFDIAINTVVENDESNAPAQPQNGGSGQPGGVRKRKKRNCRFL